MKRTLFGGIAIAVSFGLATVTFGQTGNSNNPLSNYRYSSYGYQDQDEQASPSDQVVPVPVPDAPAPTPGDESTTGSSVYQSAVSGDCNTTYNGAGIGRNANWVVGVRGLIFGREYEDDVNLGSNGFGEYLFSTDADNDAIGGMEAYFGVRRCNGWGWQLGYWGLFQDSADLTFNGPGLYTNLRGLSGMTDPISGLDVATIFDDADDWRLYRDTEVHNMEWNLLRNAGCFQGLCCRSVNVEWLTGFRWLRFREDLRFGAFNADPAYPQNMFYDLDTTNNLYGWQFGVRTDHCLTNRLSLSIGTKFGIYANDIRARQNVNDGYGNFADDGVGDYYFQQYKNDVGGLGELDLGLNYDLGCCWRFNIGYRVLGISGIALAANQIPVNFNDELEVDRVKSNCSLILHGGYFGLERSF